MLKQSLSLVRDNRGFLFFIMLLFCFRSTVADWNFVPTGSMEPSILIGDRVFVNKMAYDYRLPFTHFSLYRRANPNRGDIIVFDSERADLKLIKRVIGIPGDQVSMVNNQLIINGEPAEYSISDDKWSEPLTRHLLNTGSVAQEYWGELDHPVRFEDQPSHLSDFGTITIPPDFILALGDNRDRSSDSRVIGLIPRNEITGKAVSVVVSLDKEDYYLPRQNRFFQTLP
jgi:signal peptidase I